MHILVPLEATFLNINNNKQSPLQLTAGAEMNREPWKGGHGWSFWMWQRPPQKGRAPEFSWRFPSQKHRVHWLQAWELIINV